MNNRKLHRLWKQFRAVSYWYFLVIFVVSSVVAAFALRNNNLTAVKLRDEVLKVDKQNGDVSTALNNLRGYIYSHMNTDLSTGTSIQQPIQLKYSYERLVAAEKSKVTQKNQQVYTDAQHHCEKLYPASFSGGPRVPCIKQYIASHSVSEQTIPDALYKFSFLSPTWTPDLAGWSVVVAGLSLMLFVVSYSLDRWTKAILKRHE